ncbi:hypothetical protein ACM0P9_05660 [Streptococcus pluranimalium]
MLAFDGASANIFSEIAALKQAVDQGLAMVMSDFKGASSIPTIKGRSLPWVKTINASVAKFSDDGEEAAKLLDNHILKEEMKEYEKGVQITDAQNLAKITGMTYEDAYNFVLHGVLSQENKEKVKKNKRCKKIYSKLVIRIFICKVLV